MAASWSPKRSPWNLKNEIQELKKPLADTMIEKTALSKAHRRKSCGNRHWTLTIATEYGIENDSKNI